MEGSGTSRFWRHSYCPFDAIGVPPSDIGPLPTSQAAFEKTVNYARIVTWRPRLAQASAPPLPQDGHPQPATQMLPYADHHVETAVQYFTQGDPSGRLLPVAWEWAFQDVIVQQSQCHYTRSWAPELVWEDRVLAHEVVVYDLRPMLAAFGVAVPGPYATTSSWASGGDEERNDGEEADEASVNPAVGQSRQGPTTQKISQGLIDPRIDRKSRSGQQSRVCSLEELQQHPLSQSNDQRARGSPTLDCCSPALLPSSDANKRPLQSHGNQQQERQQRQREREQSDPSFDERYIPSRQSNPSWRFVGFHREQVHLAGEFVTEEWDYRQTVWRYLDADADNLNHNQQQQHGGRAAPYWIMTRYNMAGELIPDDYRFQQRPGEESSVRTEDILFRDGCNAEGCGGEDSSVPAWIPTPVEPQREFREQANEPRRSRRNARR